MPNRSLASFFTNAAFLWNLVFALTMLVYAVGLFIPIMEPDAAVYAQVSMEMHDRGDYLSIYHKGVDWLDKPHFPFWMSALSYEVFGVNTFAYKFPAILFILLAAFYTFLFGKKFYSSLHGWLAVIILITAEHIIISNQDVRAEPFMTGLMIMALYHLACLVSPSSRPRQLFHMVFASLAAACLIMTKGLFTIIPLASGIGFALLYQRRWKDIFHWRWLVIVVLTTFFLSPAIYGYYQQFDKYPEKVVFGQTGVSGVEFFLWTSQWGRFTNTGPIKGKGDITFFIHTMLWAFLPWAFAAFFALFRKIRELIRGITYGENFTFFGFITLFLIFSASKFQLSFYLNPLFPLLAILTTAVLLKQSSRIWRIFSSIHLTVCILLVIGMIALQYFFSAKMVHVDTIAIVVCALFVGFFLFSRREKYLKKTVFATAMVVLAVNYFVNRDFYPELLTYQAESEAAEYIQQNSINPGEVVFVDEMESVADVILHAPTRVVVVDSVKWQDVSDKYVFTSPLGREKIDSMGLKYTEVTRFEDFPVTRLTGKFINRATRHLEVKTKYLLKVRKPDMDKPRVEVSLLLLNDTHAGDLRGMDDGLQAVSEQEDR